MPVLNVGNEGLRCDKTYSWLRKTPCVTCQCKFLVSFPPSLFSVPNSGKLVMLCDVTVIDQ